MIVQRVPPLSCAPSLSSGFKRVFALVATEGTRLSAHSAHRRGKTKRSTRREAESCADGLSFTMEAQRGNENKKRILARTLPFNSLIILGDLFKPPTRQFALRRRLVRHRQARLFKI